MKSKTIYLEVEPSVHFLHAVQVLSEAVMRETGLGAIDENSKTYNFVLAVDEIVTNIFKHGLEKSKIEFKITIKYEIQKNKVSADITDQAPAYTTPNGYDEKMVLEKYCGMGLHFVRTLMDEYTYFYDEKTKTNHVHIAINI